MPVKHLYSVPRPWSAGAFFLLALVAWLLVPAASRAQSWSLAEALPPGESSADGYVNSKSTATDAQGNVYVAGNFYGRVSFGATTLVATGDESNADFFVAKISPAGQWLWAVQGGGSGTDYAADVVVNGQGDAFIAGRVGPSAVLGGFTLTSPANYSNNNAFVAKLTTDGQFAWAIKASAADASSLALDPSGNLLVAGQYSGSAAVIGSTTLPAYGSSDVWIGKLNPAGNQWQWAVRAGGSSNDYAQQLGTDATGNAYLLGQYLGTASFGTFQLTATSYSGYITKLSPAGQFLYATRFTSTNTVDPQGLAVSAAGEAYVTGQFKGTTLTLGTLQLTNDNSSGSSSYNDGFVARLTPAGGWQWAVRFGGAFDDSGQGLALDGTGGLYLTGGLESPRAVFGSTTLSAGAGGTSNAFVSRLSAADGSWAWATAVGGYDDEQGTRLSVGPGGTVAVTGSLSSVSNTFGSTVLSGTAVSVYPSAFVAQLAAATGSWNWALATEVGGDKRAFGVCTDAQGNLYTTGTFRGSVRFGSTTLRSTSSGNDVFVAKRSPAGQWLWAVRAGGDADDRGLALSVDAQGNTYLCGYFGKGNFPVSAPAFTATFGSTTLTSTGSGDLFVAKLDGAGQWQWATQAGGNGDDQATGIGVDGAGAVYVTGTYYTANRLLFGTLPLSGTSSAGGAYAARLNAAGQWQWAVGLGTGTGFTATTARGLAVDAAGAVYVTGGFGETKTFGSTSLTSAGSSDLYLARLDGATGLATWAVRAGGSSADEGAAVALDAAGNPYVAGKLSSRTATLATTALGNANPGLLVAQLTPSGSVGWVAVGQSSSAAEANALAVAPGGAVYVAGQFQGTLTLGNNVLTSTTGASGFSSYDLVTARLSPTGAWQQAVQPLGGTAGEYATGLALSPSSGALYVTGYSYSSALSFGATVLTGYSTYPTGFLAGPAGLVTAATPAASVAPLTVVVFPNPTTSVVPTLQLAARPNTTAPVLLTVYDALGRRRLSRLLPAAATTLSLPEILAWPRGTYLLTVQSGTSRQVLRLVRE